MNIDYVYNEVKEYVKEHLGTSVWCYTDFFLDEKGFSYFKEEVEIDSCITKEMDDDDIVEYICQSLSQNETMRMFQQTMLEL